MTNIFRVLLGKYGLDLPEFWPYGHLKGPKTGNEALKSNILSALRSMDENLRQHEKV